jgi:hypothetical protein
VFCVNFLNFLGVSKYIVRKFVEYTLLRILNLLSFDADPDQAVDPLSFSQTREILSVLLLFNVAKFAKETHHFYDFSVNKWRGSRSAILGNDLAFCRPIRSIQLELLFLLLFF